MKTQINIDIDKELLSDLNKYALELKKTRAGIIEKAVSAYFDKLDEMVSDKRIEGIISGESEIITLDEVFKKAGIDV
jgi:metal-responsive CopG/Arc/MetJ family transcriptional regulator